MGYQNPMEIPHWDGLTVKEFCDSIGVSDSLARTLHAIDKYNGHTIDVFIDSRWIHPGDNCDQIKETDAIERLRVRGTAWDCSDWEWGMEVSGNDDPKAVMERLSEARDQFEDALKDYLDEKNLLDDE